MDDDQGDPHGNTKPHDSSKPPELAALVANLVRYEIAAATERQARDLWLATVRDTLHSYLKTVGFSDVRIIHGVIDNIDEFLRRSKK